MFQIPNDDVAKIPLRFSHKGAPVAAPADGQVSSSDDTLATAVLSDDKSAVIVTPLVPSGTVKLTYATGSLITQLDVEITVPGPDAVEFDPAAAELSAKA